MFAACHPLCLECGSFFLSDCSVCIEHANNDADGHTCQCDDHYFFNESETPPICSKCHEFCEDCSGELLTDCLDCKGEDEGIRNNLGTCECMSDSGFYETSSDPVECNGILKLISLYFSLL